MLEAAPNLPDNDNSNGSELPSEQHEVSNEFGPMNGHLNFGSDGESELDDTERDIVELDE